MNRQWRYSLGLATSCWIAATLVVGAGYHPGDGPALFIPAAITLMGWIIGGFRQWPGVLLGLLGLAVIVTFPVLPTAYGLIAFGTLLTIFAPRFVGTSTQAANVERAYTERFRRETARIKLRNEADLNRVAGGVAHEFNNLFTGILGHANRIRESLGEHAANADIRAIEHAVARASEICAQIVAYAGRGTVIRQPLILNEFIRAVVTEIRPRLPNEPNIQIIEIEPVPVSADAVQLRRLLTNLLANAAEALKKPGDSITIRFGRESAADPSPDVRVWIEIADSGCGIEAVNRDRVFDPFFTTKAPGRGLGLAAVRGIARAHDGTVTIASGAAGTIVRVELLDRPDQDLIATPPPARGPTVKVESTCENDIALVVDDDATVRELAAVTLRAAGWSVLTAENGEEALKIVAARGSELKLIVLDLLMPVMDGQMTLTNLRRSGSRVPVIVMSAYSDFDLSGAFAGSTPMAYLRKPFRPPELLECAAILQEKMEAERL